MLFDIMLCHITLGALHRRAALRHAREPRAPRTDGETSRAVPLEHAGK